MLEQALNKQMRSRKDGAHGYGTPFTTRYMTVRCKIHLTMPGLRRANPVLSVQIGSHKKNQWRGGNTENSKSIIEN